MRRPILTILFCIFFFVLIDAIRFKRQQVLSNGANCTNDSDCVSSICSVTTKKCSTVDFRKSRDPCLVDKACANFICSTTLDANECALKDSRDIGEACLGDNECASQCCRVNRTDSINTCQTIDTRIAGFHCQTNGSCASNICNLGNFSTSTAGTCADCKKEGCVNT
ncbi:hypothetical protein F8M41_004952 [Gigaspora margarita]|uniref:Uncharacterized protein n=1 Tax=Gigaspora margarita TaxID=4874 RepID=A0A8H4ERN0_GIGMA|nr:hypothetical protein F8M41_004952 [Gigaspora margarita]